MVKKNLDNLEELSDRANKISCEKFNYVFGALKQSPNCRKESVTKEFDNYLRVLIVLGYTFSNHNLNLIKPKLIVHLVKKIGFAIKKANNYLCIKTNKLRFVDIRHSLDPGFSYAKFLKAYHCEGEKFYFPYEYITSLEILDEEALPPQSAFYSSPIKSNISEEKYEFVKKVWMEKKLEIDLRYA